MATVAYHHLKLFDIPPVQKEEKAKIKKPPKQFTEKEREQNKRKYNASYRLRKKVGHDAFPKKSRNIFCELGNAKIENMTEIKILTKEYGFAVKPLAFSNL